MAQKEVIIYSVPTCPYCVMVKQYLKQKGIEFTEFDVSRDLFKAMESERKSGSGGVPVIDIGGKIILGFNKELIEKILEQ
ncbi:MAG: glutaredoxin domain-containing protein [Candidatus Diapherotrites archaeon]